MRIVSQSPTELVVKDSSVWISTICASAALVIILFGLAEAQPKTFLVAALFLLFATIAARSITFTFDGVRRVVRWRGYKPFRSTSGEIPFDDITDITTEALSSSDRLPTYRLAILTAQGATPMAYAYTGRSDAYAELRGQILEFIRPGLHQRMPNPTATSSDDLDSSIRSLLMQGRKMDAVTLLRSRQRMALKDAVARVNAVSEKLKAETQPQ
jgi:hypothetical protein